MFSSMAIWFVKISKFQFFKAYPTESTNINFQQEANERYPQKREELGGTKFNAGGYRSSIDNQGIRTLRRNKKCIGMA